MLPKGYVLYETRKDFIKVAVTDFLLMTEDAPVTLSHKGKSYKRGLLDIIPTHLVGEVCSIRIYDLIKENTSHD